jgi:hypothetical protein
MSSNGHLLQLLASAKYIFGECRLYIWHLTKVMSDGLS